MCYLDRNDSDVPFNFDRHDMTYWPVVITASLSIFGSLFIVSTYLLWKDIRRATARRLLVFVSLADFANSLGSLVGAVQRFKDEACQLQSLVTTLSCLSFILWTTLLAVYLYDSVVKGNVKLSPQLEAVFHIIGWGIPCVATLSAFFLGGLGDDKSTVTPGWCWIRREPSEPLEWSCERARLFWMLVTGKAWEVLSYVALPVLYVLVKRHVKREASQLSVKRTLTTSSSLQAAEKKLVKFTAIPLAYILLRIWGTVRFFFDVSHFNFTVMEEHGLDKLYKAFLYLQAVGDNGQGFANFIIFCCFTERIRSKLLQFFLIRVRHWPGSKEPVPTLSASTVLQHSNGTDNNSLHSLPLNKSQVGERSPLLDQSTQPSLQGTMTT